MIKWLFTDYSNIIAAGPEVKRDMARQRRALTMIPIIGLISVWISIGVSIVLALIK